MEEAQRAAIVAEARSWISTPYHHAADVKYIGVDCGLLIVRAFVDTGLTEAFDPRPYPQDWMLHRGEEKYLGFILKHMREVESPRPGDVMVFRFGRCYSHGGIVTAVDPLALVHAFANSRSVIEEEVETSSALCDPNRKPRFFSYWAPV